MADHKPSNLPEFSFFSKSKQNKNPKLDKPNNVSVPVIGGSSLCKCDNDSIGSFTCSSFFEL